MTHDDMSALLERIFDEVRATRAAGQKEYGHSATSSFGNFERLAAELGVSREFVLWIYARKHIDGVAAYIRGHKSQREDVRGRIKDLIVYLALLWGMVDETAEVKTLHGYEPAQTRAFEHEFHCSYYTLRGGCTCRV